MSPHLDPPSDTAVTLALAFVAVGPRKTPEWVAESVPLCGHCEPCEDVSDAAARILAAEVLRLRDVLAASSAETICCVCGATPTPHEIREMSPRCGQRLCAQCQEREARTNAAVRWLAG